jgi:hypothetical protein
MERLVLAKSSSGLIPARGAELANSSDIACARLIPSSKFLKQSKEDQNESTELLYVTYIKTTPEEL